MYSYMYGGLPPPSLRRPTSCCPASLHFHTYPEHWPLPTRTECSVTLRHLHCWSNWYSLHSCHLHCWSNHLHCWSNGYSLHRHHLLQLGTATVCVQVLSRHWTEWPQHRSCSTRQARCSVVWSQSHPWPNLSNWIQLLHSQYDSCVQPVRSCCWYRWFQCHSKWKQQSACVQFFGGKQSYLFSRKWRSCKWSWLHWAQLWPQGSGRGGAGPDCHVHWDRRTGSWRSGH